MAPRMSTEKVEIALYMLCPREKWADLINNWKYVRNSWTLNSHLHIDYLISPNKMDLFIAERPSCQ